LLFSASAIFSCDTEERPEDILSEREMINILVDFHLTEAKLKALKLNRDSSENLFSMLDDEVYEKYGIDDTAYLNSYRYYLDRPQQLNEIYAAVVDSLSFRQKIGNIE